MSVDRLLRGGCHCGRNRYIIQFPRDETTTHRAQVLFHPQPSSHHPSAHKLATGSPLPAYLRVPLQWYHSSTCAFFPDETNAQIKRVYTSPREQHAMRHFCGFCGTPLSYWSEEPRSEAEFIQLTLGSLSPGDLADLEDLGLLPGSPAPGADSEDEGDGVEGGGDTALLGTAGPKLASSLGHLGTVGALPWFDSLTEGSRLGTLRRANGEGTNPGGTVRVQWEVVEWTEEADDEMAAAGSRNGKRKIGELEEVTAETEGMEGVLRGGK
ncbi:hypothetical protein MMYC01_209815 [Madurella mycetomatis]|uniref:CENP-V/GFA domain-containing protein n=1 Tax=Madurella mycetomatis TaxID=100816 RepID=A0A175VS62_9PEZI|nr:hypothetical protein MMYC01_209815 [Madurella mycetomatis]